MARNIIYKNEQLTIGHDSRQTHTHTLNLLPSKHKMSELNIRKHQFINETSPFSPFPCAEGRKFANLATEQENSSKISKL